MSGIASKNPFIASLGPIGKAGANFVGQSSIRALSVLHLAPFLGNLTMASPAQL